MRRLLFSSLIVALLPSLAAADIAQTRVEQFLKGLTTLRAEFVQTVTDAEGRVVDSANGRLSLSRPGRFRWDYQVPEQQIVSDGKRIWLYDIELAQVTVREAGVALARTPAALLAGDGKLGDTFDFADGGISEGLAWSVLKPRDGAGDFQEIQLAFSQNSLVRMQLSDRLGQVTRLQFSKVERNPGLASGLFNFVAPPGVDVVGNAAP